MARRKNVDAASVTETAGTPLPQDVEALLALFGVVPEALIRDLTVLFERNPALSPASPVVMAVFDQYLTAARVREALESIRQSLWNLVQTGRGPIGHQDSDYA